jgi:TonB family protein
VPLLATPALVNEVRLAVRRDGRVAEAALVTRSLADAADRALLAAIRDADSAQVLPALPAGSPEKVTVFLSLVLGGRTQHPDSATTATATRRDVAVLSLPQFRDARGVRPAVGQRGPKYPPGVKAVGREGSVDLSFVVDETGRVTPGTVRLVSFTTAAFAQAVLDIVPRFRLEPATIGGCPVKQLVRQPFQFHLTY